MNNLYLDEFEELQKKDSFRGQQWFGERQRLVEKYSWAVPNDEVIMYLAEFDRLYEAGAGSGYWANLIEDNGGDVIPFDEAPPTNTYTTVDDADVYDYIDMLEDAPVLVVWPPYDTRMAEEVLYAPPSHVLYVGEPHGGCTGSDTFFEILHREYGLVARIEIPSYVGVNDDFYHYVRKV